MPSRYTGVSNLLALENCTMILIDHQPLQFAGVQNIDGTLLVNNVVGLAKTAKAFGVPTILTTVLEERDGHLLKEVQDIFPDQKPINRTTLNRTGKMSAWSMKSRRLAAKSSLSRRCGPRYAWPIPC
jgi:nicotinamidase-related amidase